MERIETPMPIFVRVPSNQPGKVLLSPDGSFLLVIDIDGSARLYEFGRGGLLLHVGSWMGCSIAAFRCDQGTEATELALAGDCVVYRFDLKERIGLPYIVAENATALAYQKGILRVGTDLGTILDFDLEGNVAQAAGSILVGEAIAAIYPHPGEANFFHLQTDQGKLYEFDSGELSEIPMEGYGNSCITALARHSSLPLLASATRDGKVILADANSDSEAVAFQTDFQFGAHSLLFTRDGKHVLVCGRPYLLRVDLGSALWHADGVETMGFELIEAPHFEGILAIAERPDGQLMIVTHIF